jgi:serine/threonine protein kinase
MLPPKLIQIEYLSNQSYVIADVIEGGMGKVLKLYPVLDDLPVVAMKTIRGASSIKLFDAECEAWLSIAHHPNIAKSFSFGTWDGMPSVMVEWYPSSLDKLKVNGVSLKNLKRLIVGTVQALNYAYTEKTLIHQDIKPANILIDGDGNAKLSDFGLAKCITESIETPFQDFYDQNIKATAALSGTPYFMAPELWANTKPSVKSDIFSLGVTFYNALTGEHPYVEMGEPRRKIHPALRMDVLEYIANQIDGDSKQILLFLKKCLELNHAARYQNYEEILTDFGIEVADQPVGWTFDSSTSIANVSNFYLVKGDKNKALDVLEKALKKHPNDIVLISRLSGVHLQIGSAEESELYSGIAYNNLLKTKGVFLGVYDPSPAFVWVKNLVKRKSFSEAANVVKGIFEWEKTQPKDDKNLTSTGKYAEVGWYYLYIGEFKKSFDSLIKYALRNSLEKDSATWLVESAWLSNAIKHSADEIADKLLKLTPATVANLGGELEFLWARVILKEYANGELSSKLWKTSSSSLFVETSNLEKQYNIKAGSLLLPKTIELQKPFALTIDQLTTGGIHREFIESI